VGPPLFRVWDDALTPDQCSALIAEYFLTGTAVSGIFPRPEVAARVLSMVRQNVPGFPADAVPTGSVTFHTDTKPIGWHYDKPKGATHKLLLYLNEVPSGGTLFSRHAPVLVKNRLGRAVLFPMHDLEHASETFDPRHRKYTLGLRLVLSAESASALMADHD